MGIEELVIMKVLALFLALLVASGSCNAPFELSMDPLCRVFVDMGKLEPGFPGIIAHGIHSMSLDDLHFWFNSSAAVSNGIPVVNPDLQSSDPILLGTPQRQRSPFRTRGLRNADWIMSHVDNPFYDMGRYTALERLLHVLHMDEVWAEASIAFKGLQRNSNRSDLCPCLVNIENNGVLAMLRLIALQIREPELMIGRHVTIDGKSYSWNNDNVYNYGFFDETSSKGTDHLPSLKTESSWSAWKDLMTSIKGKGADTLANFVYCMLN